MNDTIKTLGLFAAALVVVGLTYATKPTTQLDQVEVKPGTELFKDYEDPTKATALTITEYDEERGQSNQFKVERTAGVWTLPSFQKYPADANGQIAAATLDLKGIKIIERASKDRSQFELYGVIDPTDSKQATEGVKGVGKHVKLEDQAGNTLVNLIIGKAVPDRTNLRYVRRPTQDETFVCEIETGKLTTKLSDWIEPDLLKLNAFDIKRLNVHDSSFQQVLNPRTGQVQLAQIPRSKFIVDYDNKASKWSLAKLEEPNDEAIKKNDQDNMWKARALATSEELDNTKLNDLKTALDDLKIVNVEKKPEGLTADLVVGDDLREAKATLQSLADRGFYPFQVGRVGDKPRFELLSDQGEVVCLMNDGVEYTLRFGSIAGENREGNAAKKEDAKEDEKKDDKTGSSVSRFIMVSARLNSEMIPAPELKPLPGGPSPDAKPEAKPAEQKPDEKKADEKKADGACDVEPANDKKAADPKTDEKNPAAEVKTEDKKPTVESKPVETKAPSETKSADTKAPPETKPAATPPMPPVTKSAEPKTQATEEKKPVAETKTPDATKPAAPPTKEEPKPAVDPEEAKKKLEAERKAIETENKQKQDAYEQKLKDAQKKVDDLNRRFGTWYYVISDSTYKKIHLSGKDIVKKKEGAEEPAADPLKKGEELKKGLDDK